MSELHRIPAGAVRAVWLFAIDLPESEIRAFTNPVQSDDRSSRWPLREALGVPALDPDFVEVFDTKTLDDFGLSRYLTEANGMDDTSVAPDAEALDALTGTVVLVLSSALPDNLDRIAPTAPLRLIGRYSEQPDMRLRPPLHSKGAAPQPAEHEPESRKPPSDAAMSGRIAMLVLVVLAVLVGLMIWVGG